MAVNLRAPFLCLQEAVRSMKARGGGSVVNIGSINAYVGLPALGPYSISKGGLMTMTKNAAVALGRYRIRVNQLNVGWTLTEGEEKVQRSDGKGPTGCRMPSPRDPGGACSCRPTSRWLPRISRPMTARSSAAPSSTSNSFGRRLAGLVGAEPTNDYCTWSRLRARSASPPDPARAFAACAGYSPR